MQRHFKILAAILAVSAASLFTACKKDDTTNGSTTGTGSTNASGASANPDLIVVSTCATATGIAKALCLADAFKAQLDATQLATLPTTYSTTSAKKWSNLPQGLVNSANKRIRLNFGSMTTVQIQYAKALVKELSGMTANEGWDEIQLLLNADEYLNANGGGSTYGAANYYVAFLGTPATTGTFEIQFGGHHLACASMYKDGVLTGATPTFRGVEPFATFALSTTNQPIQQEPAAFTAMLNGLSSTEQATAKLSSTYSDVLLGPGQDGQFPATRQGVRLGELSATQQQLALQAIKRYVGDLDAATAAPILARYTAELPVTYVAFVGSGTLGKDNDYIRLDGPNLWLEYSGQPSRDFPGTVHPHSVWRDRTTDYGGH